jgi:putative ABC transport system permease protein
MLSDFILRLRALFKRTAVDREIDEELRFHIDRQLESYEKAGVDRAEALRRTRLEFGGLDQVKDEYRDALGVRVVDDLLRDLRLAIRSLRATPVVSSVAVLSLTLGIGANTAIFSIVNSLLLRALPVERPERLAILLEDGHETSWTNPVWEDFRGRSDLFDGTLAWATERFDLAQGGEAQMIDGIWASGSFFDVLGVRTIAGRPLRIEDDRRGGGPNGAVVVISDGFWARQFNRAADAIGRQITLGRIPFTIVGVTPPGFFGPDVGRAFDVIVPLGTEPLVRGKETWLDERWSWWLNIMVRLKPDQTIGAAEAALASVQRQVRAATLPPSLYPGDLDAYLTKPMTLAPAATGRSPLRSRYQRPLLTILIVAGLVLLIACANIANLLLARATARRHEFGVRLALGASSWRLGQQLLTESLVVACAGAGIGLLFAQWAGRAIIAQLSTQANLVFLDLAPDWRVLGFTTALTMLTAIVFGTAPALRASRVALIASMKDGGRTPAGDRRHGMASALVVVQVALSLMLVVVAGLFVRTFISLATLPLGLEPERVLLVNVDAPQSRFGNTDLGLLFDDVRVGVAAVPGVAHAAMSRMAPVTGGGVWNTSVNVEGAPPLPDRQRRTLVNAITPQWFAAVGMPLVAGRDFNEADRTDSPFVAIINRAFARQFGLGENPVGRVILRREPRSTADVPVQIVGFAADAVYRLLRDPMPATMYVPLAQQERAPSSITLSVRSAGGSALTKSVGSAIAAVNRDLVLTFRLLQDQVNATLIQERLLAMLSGFFGGLALLLAGLGLYGITSYAVNSRRSEIGIRMALGAAPGGVIRLVMTRMLVLVLLGVGIGGVASAWASRFVATLVFGLEPHDPATLIGASGMLAAVAAVAGWLPARRAARIDPAAVLRES